MATNKRLIKSNDDAAPIVPTSFNTVLYTGNGSTGRQITGVGFQPDWTWIKKRSSATFSNHMLFDSVRGADKVLITNLTQAEYDGTGTGYLPSFDSDGFSLTGNTFVNGSGDTYVAWNWKAGGAAVTNTDGTITSQVSANTEAGFSVVTWTANGSSSATVGHGLNAEPSLIIVKARSGADPVTNWGVYHSSLGNTKYLYLNRTDAEGTSSAFWNNTSPTSSVFTVSNSGNINGLINNMVSYCFAEVAGFSKFGSYTGNGSTSGPTIDLGFEPAFVMIKRTNGTGGLWIMKDNKRDTTNPNSANLYANTSAAEDTDSVINVNFLSNGFQPAGTYIGINGNGSSYIYMAFANQF